MADKRDLTFPPFRLDLANERLWRGSELLALRPKAFLLLRYLAEHPERLITQEELLKAIRQATHTNRVFGSELFQKQIEAVLALHILKRKPGPRRKESSY